MDSILKNVQGDYIKHFEAHIAQVFIDTFQRAATMEEKKSLIKMFKIWDLFFSLPVLESISQACSIPEYVSL